MSVYQKALDPTMKSVRKLEDLSQNDEGTHWYEAHYQEQQCLRRFVRASLSGELTYGESLHLAHLTQVVVELAAKITPPEHGDHFLGERFDR